jgi:type IV secretion system protein VirD4
LDFERALREDLPRGQKGNPDRVTGAAWADAAQLSGKFAYDRSSLFLGFRNGEGIGWKDDRHVVTVAGSRAGKGVSLMIPNLLLYEGSVLAIDPKGELARVTGRARAEKGQKRYILDPFGENGLYPSDCFNPLAELDRNSPSVVDDAALVADALIQRNERDPHWTDSARRLLKVLILYLIIQENPEIIHLGYMRDLLMLRAPEIRRAKVYAEANAKAAITEEEALFNLLIGTGDVMDGAIRGEGQAFLALYKRSDRECASILSTARTQTEFLDSMPMRAISQRSDFRLRDLKREDVTVYVCLPAMRMSTHANWLRVLITQALIAFESEPGRPNRPPVLMLLEEFPVLGYMRAIEAAAGQIAGFGVKLWTVMQDLTQIKKLYRSSWETFFGNAGVLTFFGNTDVTTLEHVSRKLGRIGMRVTVTSNSSMPELSGGAKPFTETQQESPLLHPAEIEQIFRRDTNRMLVLAAGEPPLIVERAIYHAEEEFAGLYDDHQKPPGNGGGAALSSG